MNNFDDSYNDVRVDKLQDLVDRLQGDLKAYKRDFIEGARVGKNPEQKVLASTQARVRLNDTLHEIQLHMEEDWGVYDAERLYPTENLSSGEDLDQYSDILGL